MIRFAKVVGLIAVLALLLVPAVAQDDVPPGSGEGGIVFTWDNSQPRHLNPLLSADGTSNDFIAFYYPALLGVDYKTGLYQPGAPGSMATGWEFDETGTVLTVNLREDAVWSDGVPITAHDYVWYANAFKSGLVDTPYSTSMFEALDDGTPGSGHVVDVVALDDYTIEITFNSASCVNIADLTAGFVPSHVFEADFGDDLADMNNYPEYPFDGGWENPGVTWGPFTNPVIEPGARRTLQADFSYPDAYLGYVSPSEWVTIELENSDIAMERFRAGEITIAGIPGTDQAEFENDPNYQTFRYVRDGYVWFGFNLANPENPQPGVDDDGNVLEQDPHPILSDKLVRQAISYAVDIDAIIENNLGGNAVRVGSHTIPISWDWSDDLLYPFDPAQANDLLDQAGWMDEDGDGVRECVSCTTAEVGTPMALTLNTSAGADEDSLNMYEFIAQSMRDIGIDAEIASLEWSEAFLPALIGQTYDMALLAWGFSLPIEPDDIRGIFGINEDIPGAGFNTGSFYNEELEQVLLDGIDPTKTDGCTVEGRLPYYQRAHEILHEEAPYLFMYANLRMTAAQGNVENWDPAAYGSTGRTWQIDAWEIAD